MATTREEFYRKLEIKRQRRLLALEREAKEFNHNPKRLPTDKNGNIIK